MESKVIKKVNSRLEASTAAVKLDPRNKGETVNIVGLKSGEAYRGDYLWYVDSNDMHYTASAIALNLQNNRLNKFVDFPSVWRLAYKHALKVGIYDTGVRSDSSMLAQRVTQLNHTDSDIKSGHGDYMATIIAGSDVKNGYVGFLPNAQIYSYQSPWDFSAKTNIVSIGDLKIALQRFLEEKVNIVNISMRSNTENNSYQTDPQLKSLIDKCNKEGIVINCCSGQDRQKFDSQYFYPARLQGVFSVAGTFGIDNVLPELYWRTNLWTGIDLLAPSDEIYSTQFFLENNITEREGTSVSAAITTGVLGLLRIKYLTDNLSVSFASYLDTFLKSMPDLPISADLQKHIVAKSFKTLNFQTLKTILQT